ncbi:hypothetical protein EHS43_23075, partial [Streptomyces sp. RP5T]
PDHGQATVAPGRGRADRVGHYRTPSGRGVDGRGITPDLEADEGRPASRWARRRHRPGQTRSG